VLNAEWKVASTVILKHVVLYVTTLRITSTQELKSVYRYVEMGFYLACSVMMETSLMAMVVHLHAKFKQILHVVVDHPRLLQLVLIQEK
jgi:hypothetical protein